MNEAPGRNHSTKRDAILEVIKSTKGHPGATWVYDTLKPEIPELSLGTVYRNIRVLLDGRKLASVGVVNGEERFDGTVEPHPHFVCEKCGGVFDPAIPAYVSDNFSIEISGCAVDKRKTVFYGLCEACNKGS